MLLEQHPSRAGGGRGGGALPSGKPDKMEQWERGCDELFLSAARSAPRLAVLLGEPLPTQQFPETQACSLPAQLHSPTPQNPFLIYLFKKNQNKSLDWKTPRPCLGLIPALLPQVVPPTPPFGIEAVSSCA